MSCPRCGNEFAYVGLHVVECPNFSCDNHVREKTPGGTVGRSLQDAYEAEDIIFVGTASMSHGRAVKVKEDTEILWDLLSAQGQCMTLKEALERCEKNVYLWCNIFNVGEDR